MFRQKTWFFPIQSENVSISKEKKEGMDGKLIKIDNQFIHSQVVKSAIVFLHNKKFLSVTDEFMIAHEHYIQRDFKDAIVTAGKAMESIYMFNNRVFLFLSKLASLLMTLK